MKTYALVLSAGLLALGAASTAQAATCSNSSITGRFIFSESGTVVGYGPVASAGHLIIDKTGHGIVNVTSSINGVSSQLTGSGTFVTNPDCTGTVTFTDSTGAITHADFFSNGTLINFIFTDPGVVITGTANVTYY